MYLPAQLRREPIKSQYDPIHLSLTLEMHELVIVSRVQEKEAYSYCYEYEAIIFYCSST